MPKSGATGKVNLGALNPGDKEHGTQVGYWDYSCRCNQCIKAAQQVSAGLDLRHDDDVREEIAEARRDGESIETIATAYNVSRPVISDLLRKEITNDERKAIRENGSRLRAQKKFDTLTEEPLDIVAAAADVSLPTLLRSIDSEDIAERVRMLTTGLPDDATLAEVTDVTGLVSGQLREYLSTVDYATYAGRSTRGLKQIQYSDKDIINALRRANKEVGEPLTASKYKAWASQGEDLGEKRPSIALVQQRRYKSWNEALESAGLAVRTKSRVVELSWPDDQGILEAVSLYLEDDNFHGTFQGYIDWRKDYAPGAPSGASVRSRLNESCGGWSDIAREATHVTASKEIRERCFHGESGRGRPTREEEQFYKDRDAEIAKQFLSGVTRAELAETNDITVSRVQQILERDGVFQDAPEGADILRARSSAV